MKYLLSISVLLFLFCSSYSQSIHVDGLERTYIMHQPKGFDKSKQAPLVIALHGGGGNAKGMMQLTSFNDISDKYGFVVVYPEGIEKQWNDGRDDFKLNKDINDVKFISCLIDSLAALYNLDTTRVYVTGMSNGAIMSFRLACELSNKLAAFAPVAGSMPAKPDYDCKPVGPVPFMIIFGEDDPIVPFHGRDISVLGFGKRGKVIPVVESVNYWVKNNKSNTTAVETKQNDVPDGTSLDKKVYASNGMGTAEVQYWLVEGGGHIWPGGSQYLPKAIIGKTSKEFDASEEIWKFFSDKSLK